MHLIMIDSESAPAICFHLMNTVTTMDKHRMKDGGVSRLQHVHHSTVTINKESVIEIEMELLRNGCIDLKPEVVVD